MMTKEGGSMADRDTGEMHRTLAKRYRGFADGYEKRADELSVPDHSASFAVRLPAALAAKEIAMKLRELARMHDELAKKYDEFGELWRHYDGLLGSSDEGA